MDFGLSHEQQLVVDTVRGFVEHELQPLEREVERTGRVVLEVGREIQRKVRDLGFYAPNIPEAFGGGDLDHLTFTLLERELGRASMALTVFWGRPSNAQLWADLGEVLKRTKADFDPTTEAARAAWSAMQVAA